MDATAPVPGRIDTLADLSREFDRLRRSAARPGQLRLSVRDLAARTGRAASTLDLYLRGQRLCPADVYEDLLRALNVPLSGMRPWLDAWDRLADARRGSPGAPTADGPSRPLLHTEITHYDLAAPARPARVGIITGDIRRVRCADVWVNPENTTMEMPRPQEFSTSAIVRYEGARRDQTGRIIEDVIADELSRRVAGRVPVAPGTAIVTGPGELAERNNVRYVVHVAAVQGEAGEGYRQVRDVGRCVTNVLAEVESRNTGRSDPARTLLLPLLGTGQGKGNLAETVATMLSSVLDHLIASPRKTVETVYFLAYTEAELEVCRAVFGSSPQLSPAPA